MIKKNLITVANCSLNQWAMDFDGNEKRIVQCIKDAKEKGAKIILMPELVTTGYSCQDHFMERENYDLAMNIIRNITLDNDLSKDTMIILGSPVLFDDIKYNTMIFICNQKIVLIRPKMILADDGNYREARFFSPWTKKGLYEFPLSDFNIQKTAPIGFGIIDMNGIKISAEVCEELWAPNPTNIPLYMSGVHIVLNSSGSHFEMNKIYKRIDLVRSATKRCGGVYMYSNCVGGDGDRLYFDGGSMTALNGNIIGIEERFKMTDIEILINTIDINDIITYRLKGASIQLQSSKINYKIDTIISNIDGLLDSKNNTIYNDRDNKKKLMNINKSISGNVNKILQTYNAKKDISNKDIVEIVNASSCWLFDYVRRSGAGGFLLPLSGGADSAAVCTIVYNMCELMKKNKMNNIVKNFLNDKLKINANKSNLSSIIFQKIITCVYLPNKGKSSSETENRSKNIVKLFLDKEKNDNPENWHNVPISPLYKGAQEIMFNNIKLKQKSIINMSKLIQDARNSKKKGIEWSKLNEQQKYFSSVSLADENIQARLRMVVTYLLAQIFATNGFLLTLACSNSDEILIGYYTKYDASSGDINPIGSLPKIYVNRILDYYGHLMLKPNEKTNALLDTLNAKPTAELQNLGKKSSGKEIIVQTDEDDFGMTYRQIEFIGNLRSQGFGMIDVYKKAKKSTLFTDENDAKKKVETFYNKYSINRNKATIVTPSVHLLPNPDDNRFDLRPFLYPPCTKQIETIEQLYKKKNHQKKKETNKK